MKQVIPHNFSDIRAMVLEDADNWYADDGALSRQLCELPEPENGKKAIDEGECCTCDEAKYQVCVLGTVLYCMKFEILTATLLKI
jgi:hypothetical protein